MTEDDQPSLRIGTTERNAAMAALDEHLSEGRLTAEEYGDRSAHASVARTVDELRALFTDLPAPHPALPGPVPVLPATTAMPVVGGTDDGVVDRGRSGVVDRGRGFLDEWGPRLAAVMPLIAVALFFATRQWWVFLLIPIAGGLFLAGRGDDDDDHDRHRSRRHGLPGDDRRSIHGNPHRGHRDSTRHRRDDDRRDRNPDDGADQT